MSTKGFTTKRSDGEKTKRLLRRIFINKQIYLMLLPVVVFYVLYSYVPMYGITLAWKDYYRKLGIVGSPWVGWEHFRYLFSMPDLPNAIRNTFIISALKLVFCFPIPIIFALLLNEMKNKLFKKSVQTMAYLPNFISWVIVGGLIKMAVSFDDGVLNNIREAFGLSRIPFMIEGRYFYPMLIFAEIWKSTGWNTIIYIAAISGIDPTLYEAAKIDGCKRLGLIRHITLPCIMPIMTIMFILALANIMNAGFDSIYNLYSAPVYHVADIIDTLSYRLFMEDQSLELSAAVGLFKTSINFVFLVAGNLMTKKISGYSMYSLD
jgi:putative aldouronate transport system permease protein